MIQATPAQVALAWLQAQDASIASIPGTRSIQRLEENRDSQNITIPTNLLVRLESMINLGVAGNRY